MMRRGQLLVVPVLVAVMSGVGVSALKAQDCGTDCHVCGPGFYWEATQHIPFGTQDMTCRWGPSCSRCMLSVGDDDRAATEIATIVRSVPLTGLRAIVDEFGDRLLLSPSRRLLAVLGNGCNPQALESVVILSQAQSDELERLGIRSLKRFLEQQPISGPAR